MAPPAVSLGRDGKLDVTGLGRVVVLVIEPRRAHRRRKPARLLDQPLGLARHVGLLQMVDHPGEGLAARLGDIGKDPRLGDAAEIIIGGRPPARSEEHTSELQSLMRTTYAVICLKKKKKQ